MIATLYIPYLAFTHLFHIRVFLSGTGTLVLTWHSRSALLLQSVIWRSAYTGPVPLLVQPLRRAPSSLRRDARLILPLRPIRSSQGFLD